MFDWEVVATLNNNWQPSLICQRGSPMSASLAPSTISLISSSLCLCQTSCLWTNMHNTGMKLTKILDSSDWITERSEHSPINSLQSEAAGQKNRLKESWLQVHITDPLVYAECLCCYCVKAAFFICTLSWCDINLQKIFSSIRFFYHVCCRCFFLLPVPLSPDKLPYI